MDWGAPLFEFFTILIRLPEVGVVRSMPRLRGGGGTEEEEEERRGGDEAAIAYLGSSGYIEVEAATSQW